MSARETNAVQQNRIQAEFIKKELNATKLRTNFTLNVHRMAQEIVSDKVTASPRVREKTGSEAMATKAGLADAGRSMLAPQPASSANAAFAAAGGGAAASLQGAAEQPNLPALSEEEASEAAREAALMAELVEQIMKPKLTPRQLYAEPITTSMRIGWDLQTVVSGGASAFQMKDFRSGAMATKWRRPKIGTELSRYCRDYVKMNGYGPYAMQANN